MRASARVEVRESNVVSKRFTLYCRSFISFAACYRFYTLIHVSFFFTSRLNSHSHLLAHLFVIILLLRFFFLYFFWLNLCHNCEVFSRIYACACASVRSHSRIVILIWYTFSEPESQSKEPKMTTKQTTVCSIATSIQTDERRTTTEWNGQTKKK